MGVGGQCHAQKMLSAILIIHFNQQQIVHGPKIIRVLVTEAFNVYFNFFSANK
jgi:hypothetical protein